MHLKRLLIVKEIQPSNVPQAAAFMVQKSLVWQNKAKEHINTSVF